MDIQGQQFQPLQLQKALFPDAPEGDIEKLLQAIETDQERFPSEEYEEYSYQMETLDRFISWT